LWLGHPLSSDADRFASRGTLPLRPCAGR
jgi:hypothetical protein